MSNALLAAQLLLQYINKAQEVAAAIKRENEGGAKISKEEIEAFKRTDDEAKKEFQEVIDSLKE